MSTSILEISKILSHLLDSHSISESELSRKINIPRATINRLASGRTPDPRASTLEAIADYFQISVDQLLGKKPLLNDIKKNTLTASRTSVPIIEWKETENWEGIIKQLKPDNHSNWVILDETVEKNFNLFALRIHGDSMWPQFQENTILIIDPTKSSKNRDFIIAYIKKDEEIIFRQLIVDGKYKFLKAINSIFPTIQIEDCDRIIGVVFQTRNYFG